MTRKRMTRTFLTFILVALGMIAQQKKPADHKHDDHKHSKTKGAHEHGSAQVNLAVEGKSVDIELHAPAMGIVGFEYVPTTAADKKKQADALAKLKANAAQLVMFEPSLGCIVSAKSAEIEQEEPDHAEVDADFHADCVQPPAGTKVSFAVTKLYPAIATVKVQAVGSSGSTGAEIKNNVGTVVLPK